MKARAERNICEINITPLTDIFLVLLIIMMVVTPLLDVTGLQTSKTSDGDAAAEQTEDPKMAQVELTQTENNDVKILLYNDAGKPIETSRGELIEALSAGASKYPDGISLEVSPDLRLEFLTMALEACQSSGVGPIKVSRPEPEKKGK